MNQDDLDRLAELEEMKDSGDELDTEEREELSNLKLYLRDERKKSKGQAAWAKAKKVYALFGTWTQTQTIPSGWRLTFPTFWPKKKAGIDADKLLDAMLADIEEAKSRGIDVDVKHLLEKHIARLQKRYDEFFEPETE